MDLLIAPMKGATGRVSSFPVKDRLYQGRDANHCKRAHQSTAGLSAEAPDDRHAYERRGPNSRAAGTGKSRTVLPRCCLKKLKELMR